MPLQPIGRLLADLAEADPDRPAITCGALTSSRWELDRRTNRLARAYAALGVGEGDLVTIGLPNGIEFYEAAIAAWKLGATPQPVSWRLPERERREIVELADPALVVGLDLPGRRSVPASFEPDPGLADGPLPDRVAPSWRAMTSGGSTGRPKLIVSGEAGEFDTDRRPYLMQPHQVRLVTGPLYHTVQFSSMLGLFLGQHVVVLERFDPVVALRAIEAHRVSYVQLVPTMLLRMWRVLEPDPGAFDLGSLEVVWHMAAPCPPWLKEIWIDLVGPDALHELYAGTEAIGATHITGREWLDHRGSVGRPSTGEFKVVDQHGVDLPPGNVGEIYMRKPQATYRYVGAEARTLPDGWESLGDMGWLDEDGYLYLTDRRSDMILSGGANIYPAEIEAAILEHPHVRSCAVVGLPDPDLGQRVHAVIQTLDGQPIPNHELRHFLTQRLVTYKHPRTHRYVTHDLRDDAGKVRRTAIRDHEASLA
jgi:bile acid-coenzyme A ligase